jgi:2-polyprenyl-3-methyl-5-hydroxy-6-metoxy-1,4-benzoquinol methylase
MTTNNPDNSYEIFFSGQLILDIPCGTGRHSIELAKIGYHLTAVDISGTFINALKKKVAVQKLDIKVIKRKYYNT